LKIIDKVAIITGAGQGIGQQIALRFAKEGANLILTDINEPGLKKTEQLIRSEGPGETLTLPVDVSSEETIKEMVAVTMDRFSRVDILVNNSGIAGPTKNIEDITLDEWDQTMAVNIRGVFLCCKHVVPVMKIQRSGSIVNISSVAGKVPLAKRTPYCSSKMAVIGLTRTLASELGEYNIRVNSICPGFVAGPRQRKITEAIAKVTEQNPDELLEAKAASVPLKTLVDPKCVAAMTAFLCSCDADMVTGQDINVSACMVMF